MKTSKSFSLCFNKPPESNSGLYLFNFNVWKSHYQPILRQVIEVCPKIELKVKPRIRIVISEIRIRMPTTPSNSILLTPLSTLQYLTRFLPYFSIPQDTQTSLWRHLS